MRVRRSPPLARTRRRIMGRRGYFGKAGSAADRWQSQKVGASIGRQEAAGASKLSRQQPAAFQAAVSSSRVGAFCFNTRMNSRIQAGWSGQARADTIIPSTTASESTSLITGNGFWGCNNREDSQLSETATTKPQQLSVRSWRLCKIKSCPTTLVLLPAPPKARPFVIGPSALKARSFSARTIIPRSQCTRTRSPST